MQHWCTLAAKESGLECTCVSNNDLIIQVSRGSRCCWVSICTVWLSHSMIQWVEQQICIKLCVNLEHSSAENYSHDWCRRLQLWATVIGSFITTARCPLMSEVVCRDFSETSNHLGDSAPLQTRFGSLWLLAFPKTKIIFGKEEILDCWWDSGKHEGADDGNELMENCVRSQGVYFEGDWSIIALCTMFPVSCIFFNKCLYFSYYINGYFMDRHIYIL